MVLPFLVYPVVEKVVTIDVVLLTHGGNFGSIIHGGQPFGNKRRYDRDPVRISAQKPNQVTLRVLRDSDDAIGNRGRQPHHPAGIDPSDPRLDILWIGEVNRVVD